MKMTKNIVFLGLAIWIFACGYWVGQSQQKIKYITKESEIVKKTAQKRAVIQSRPHITRDTALEFMRTGKL